MPAKGVLRGLHFQKQYPKAKMVQVICGAVCDVVVGLRTASPTCVRHYGILLTDESNKQFLIPHGFAHGFLVEYDVTEFCYKWMVFPIPMLKMAGPGMIQSLASRGQSWSRVFRQRVEEGLHSG